MAIDFSVVSDISTALAAVASLAAVYIAVKGLRATRNSPIADHLLQAYGEMISALQELSDSGNELAKSDPTLQSSRVALRPTFQRFEAAEFKVELIEPPIARMAEYGSWVRTIAHNFAANLVQADEFSTLRERWDAETFARFKPADLSDAEWNEVSRSDSYLEILLATFEVPSDRPGDFVSLENWWRPRVKGFGDGTGPDDHRSVYSPHMSFMIQNCRLLDDFVREYLIPWASQSVRDAIE